MAASGKDVITTIRVVAQVAMAGRRAVSYRELGLALGRAEKTAGRGLRTVLEAATVRCRGNGLPDVAPCVVLASTLDDPVPMPSDEVFDENGYWPSSGLTRGEIGATQDRVLAFDWKAERGLRLVEG
jgi:hypothetical protein